MNKYRYILGRRENFEMAINHGETSEYNWFFVDATIEFYHSFNISTIHYYNNVSNG